MTHESDTPKPIDNATFMRMMGHDPEEERAFVEDIPDTTPVVAALQIVSPELYKTLQSIVEPYDGDTGNAMIGEAVSDADTASYNVELLTRLDDLADVNSGIYDPEEAMTTIEHAVYLTDDDKQALLKVLGALLETRGNS